MPPPSTPPSESPNTSMLSVSEVSDGQSVPDPSDLPSASESDDTTNLPQLSSPPSGEDSTDLTQPVFQPSPPRSLRSALLPPPRSTSTPFRTRSRLYRGIVFQVPDPLSRAKAPFHVVTKGTRLGVFETWSETSSYVTRVKGAAHHKVDTIDNGIRVFEDAVDIGGVEVLYK
ncbi:hypothetical protein EV363DRAFT_1449216 [Boletus edulis]|nr:hypothetical protein EV363DRAFT_1449216 [Boletus edulis]